MVKQLWEHGWTEYMGSYLLRGRIKLQAAIEGQRKVAGWENWCSAIKIMLMEEHEI